MQLPWTINLKRSASWNTSLAFLFCTAYCRQNTERWFCVFLPLVSFVVVTPTSAPPPLLRWFSFLLDCFLGELVWVKNTPFWVVYLFKRRSVARSSSSYGLMESSTGVAGAVQFWMLDEVSCCWSWRLKETLMKLVSVAFHFGVNQSDLILQKEERGNMHTSFLHAVKG